MICKSLISFRSQIIAQANLDGTFDNVSNGKSTSMRTPGQYLRRLTLKDASKMGLERNAYMDSEIALLGTHGNQEKARVEAFNRATHVFKVYFFGSICQCYFQNIRLAAHRVTLFYSTIGWEATGKYEAKRSA